MLQLTEAPLQFQPHACAVTGRDDGTLVDFGVAQPGIDPRVYLKTEVVEEAASLLGMVARVEVERLAKRVVTFEEEIAELNAKVDSLTEAKRILEEVS